MGSTTTASNGTTNTAGGSTTGSNEAPDYYPMADGSSWVYFHTSKNGWEETITLADNGDGTFTQSDTPNPDGESSEAIHVEDENGLVLRTSRQQFVDDALDISVVYDPGFVRFDPAWLEMADGETVTLSYMRTETAAGAAMPDPTRERSHIYTKIGMVNHSVQGVSYSDCLQMERERNYENPTGQSEDQKKQFWFCPNVGKIQEVTTDTNNSEQLVSYTP
jgi:hypothetical protein